MAQEGSSIQLFVIERDYPGIQNLSRESLKEMSSASNEIIKRMNDKGEHIEWEQSYVCDHKLFCLYRATSEQLILEHAKLGNVPCSNVTWVATTLNDVKDSDATCKFFVKLSGMCAGSTKCLAKFEGEESSFCIVSADNDKFLSAFTPAQKAKSYSVRSIISPVSGSNDHEMVKEVVNAFGIGDYLSTMTAGALIIRPSGNPLSAKDYEIMKTNGDLAMEMSEIIEINSLDIGICMATAVITLHQRFTFKGESNDDVTVMMLVLKKSFGHWKISMAQRSHGRPTSELLPAF